MVTSPLAKPVATLESSPFELSSDAAYRNWRERKLADYPRSPDAFVVPIDDGYKLRPDERSALLQAVGKTNMAIYQLPHSGVDKAVIGQLGRQFGLRRLDNNLCADNDGITALRVVGKRQVGEYIPYTNKRLNWHTDGYYNRLEQQIRGVILHCVRPAENGGENALLDHEIAYIHVRDINPEFIRALMAADAMTIPPNIQQGRELRPAQTGPVFSVDAHGHLHMRYSARGRNIIWKDDAMTRAAADCLLNLFREGSPYIFRHRLRAGQGLISNNVLHCRSEFSDDESAEGGRLLYRARYFDRVSDLEQGG